MDYQLPEDWDSWTAEDRVAWHARRVAREEPVYEFLVEEGLWTYLEDEAIEEQLLTLREECKQVEAVLDLCQDREFQQLLRALDNVIGVGRESRRAQIRILNIQWRRAGFKAEENEEETLGGLRRQTYDMLEQAEKIEVGIVRACSKHRVDWAPFMKSHLLRS
jgi:hypothetical protein